jgi:structural maintenance of chromosome 3 (chondroitin sulfate proteoglycan 6)
MNETSAKRVKIDELLESIETRLNELEEEKKELKEYDQLDRERRCLQYGIYMREMNEISDSLENIESARRKDLEEANGLRGQSVDRERQISNLESQLTAAKQKLESLNQDKLQLEQERRESIKARTQVECMLKDSEDLKEKNGSKKAKWEKEANRLKREIDSKTQQLAILQPKYETQEKEYNQVAERLSELETIITSLYEKQGRSHQFRTQKERDQHIRAELKKLKELARSGEGSLKQVISDEQSIKDNLAEIESQASEVQTKIDDRKQWLQEKTTELSKIKAEHHQLTERRKALWKEDARISESLANATNAKEKAMKDLRVTMDRVSYCFCGLILRAVQFGAVIKYKKTTRCFCAELFARFGHGTAHHGAR